MGVGMRMEIWMKMGMEMKMRTGMRTGMGTQMKGERERELKIEIAMIEIPKCQGPRKNESQRPKYLLFTNTNVNNDNLPYAFTVNRSEQGRIPLSTPSLVDSSELKSTLLGDLDKGPQPHL